VPALTGNQKIRYKLHRLKDTLFRLGNSPGIQYYFSKDSTQTWAYLKIERFTGNNFASELNHALRKISKYKKKVLILDLRNNGGGRILLAENLLSRLYPYYPDEYVFYKKKNIGFPKKAVIFPLPYRIIQWCLSLYFRKETRNDTVWYKRNIKKKKPVPFRQIYVLSNYGTFSAASFVTARLQRDANAIVVGEETGGTAGGCNAVIILPCRLPESRIKVFFPLYRFCNSSSSCRDDGKGVKPDILIKTKISDRFAGRDRVLEQVIKIIQKNP
jgi:C-terminal processing protease CtpA/Prc